MKYIYSLLALCFLISFGNAQVTDVFLNHEYHYETHVLKAEMSKDYAPATLEIYQDKVKLARLQVKKIEEQLYNTAVKQIENEVAYFQLHTRAVNQLKQADEIKRLQERDFSTQSYSPMLERIEIKLEAVLNAVGVYYIQYNFGEIEVKEYYLAEYLQNKITRIGNSPNVRQQEKLKELTLPRFTALYLLQTQKLDLENVERIRATQLGSESSPDLGVQIDYSEAIVYPFYSGIMVEFPANSTSSSILENQPFRLLLSGSEIKQLLAVYPVFKSAFATAAELPSASMIAQLNSDANFDLSRFMTPPSELKLLEKLRLNKKIFTLSITNYNGIDTTGRFIGSKKFFFNKTGEVTRIEERNDNNDIASEVKLRYNNSNQLTDTKFSGHSTTLKLNYYDNGLLSHVEEIEVGSYNTSHGQKNVDLTVMQMHYFYNRNSRYVLSFNLVGELDRHRFQQSRHIENEQYCTNFNCILVDKKGRVIAVKNKSGSPADIRVNANNQPVESYFDYDRDRYLFTYDDKNRILSFSAFSGQLRKNVMEYKYHEDPQKPVSVFSSASNLFQEYELGFYEE